MSTKKEEFESREKNRRYIRNLIGKAEEKGNLDTVLALNELLKEVPYEFNELSYNASYVRALKDNWKFNNPQDSAEEESKMPNISDLIDQDFNHWNGIESSLVLGGEAVYDSYSEKDDDVKANALKRFRTYIDTDIFGEESRPFLEQVKGVAPGVGIDLAATSGAGTIANLTKQAFGKQASRNLLINALSSKAKLSATGATYSGVGDAELQAMNVNLGGQDSYDPLQGVASATIGAVVPHGGRAVGNVAGRFGRAGTHWMQSLGTATSKLTGGYGATSAARGVVRKAGDVLEKYGVDRGAAVDFSRNLSQVFDDAAKYFRNSYNAIPLDNINPIGIKSIVAKWKNKTGEKLPDEAKNVMKKLAVKDITPIEALRELKDVIWRASQESNSNSTKKFLTKDGAKDFLTGKSKAKNLYDQLREIERNAAINQGKGSEYKALLDADSQFRTLMSKNNKENNMGQKLLAASRDTETASKLIKDMGVGDFSWERYISFQKSLNTILKNTSNESAAGAINRNIQKTLGGFLRGDEGNYKGLIKLLNTKHGMKTLKTIYPDDAKFWKQMEHISSKLPESKGGASSVIMNMAIARLGSHIGQDLTQGAASKHIQKLGPLGGALGGISLVNKLVDYPFFQNAMINAYKRKGGTLNTATKSWLKHKGYGRKEIGIVQDTLWGMLGTGYATGSLDEIWRDNKDPIKRRLKEIELGYVGGEGFSY